MARMTMYSQPLILRALSRNSRPSLGPSLHLRSYKRAATLGLALSASLLLLGATKPLTARAQEPGRPAQAPAGSQRRLSFRAVSYDIYASLFPATQSLSARATVEFESIESSRIVECELHPNLKITAVRDSSGQVLEVDRDDYNPMLVHVTLADPIPAGQRVKLTFEYAGLLANEEQSPVPGLTLAKISTDGAFLLLPARWFPLTNYQSNRYTATFHIEVPQGFNVAGTGTSDPPAAAVPVSSKSKIVGPPAPANTSLAGRMVYAFHDDRPEASGTFVAGALQLSAVKGEGLNIAVYTPADASGTAAAYGQRAAHAVEVFSDQFGPLPQPNLAMAQIPDGTLPNFSAPGLLLISQRQWAATANENLIANLVAEQWWGNQVMAATPNDQWLTDGLARYSEALYVEDATGKNGMDKLVDDFAIGSMMYEGPTPISQADRLAPFSSDYTSVVVNKGALVYNMLRQQLGDSAFQALLRDFYTQYSGKAATLAGFEQLAKNQAAKAAAPAAAADSGFVLRSSTDVGSSAPAASDSDANAQQTLNLGPFFAQWVNSTGVPELTLNYTIFRTKAGFKIVGKVKQNLDFFHMPVELEVQTEGNTEYKTVEVSGMESSFNVDVFGRPRPNGVILDPHNYILKSSTQLRMRATIARGEALAEQGRYYDALQQYTQALAIDKTNSLAEFRTGEAFFYQKNYSAAANAFRDALDGSMDNNSKWVEVWSHIYLGKIYDVAGDRTRAVNEYSKAQQSNDDTGGAQAEVKRYLATPYTEPAAQPDAAPALTRR
jgi:tetratricopeptide (TPR) repeat protein